MSPLLCYMELSEVWPVMAQSVSSRGAKERHSMAHQRLHKLAKGLWQVMCPFAMARLVLDRLRITLAILDGMNLTGRTCSKNWLIVPAVLISKIQRITWHVDTHRLQDAIVLRVVAEYPRITWTRRTPSAGSALHRRWWQYQCISGVISYWLKCCAKWCR